MAESTEDRLHEGLSGILARDPQWRELDAYQHGTHPRPFAPEGVNQEYNELREMAVAPWLSLVVKTPIQRLRVDGFRTERDANADETFWRDVWVHNGLISRQRLVYTDGSVHGRGLIGVWPNAADKKRPVVRPESPRNVFIQPTEDDPFRSKWAVKSWAVNDPDGAANRAVYYDETGFVRYERDGEDWHKVSEGPNPLKAIPFVEFAPSVDAQGVYHSMIRPLLPMQRAIDTARFDLLLGMQFSAYRQRYITGYDPVVRDSSGEPVFKKDSAGNVVLDRNGQPEPVIASPGRPGVDRILAFPGGDTKVFDLPESNLGNYVNVISSLVQHLAAISQVPPQYLLGGLANLSGDALVAAESTLASLVSDMQDSFAGAWAQVAILAGRARGNSDDQIPTDVIWGDGQARGFAQTVDGIQKLISIGFPLRAGLEMLPGATDQKVRRWMELAEKEANDPLLNRILGKEVQDDPNSGQGPVSDPAGTDR